MRNAILPLVLIAGLAGCGLRPLYEGGSRGAVAQELGGVEVAPIAGGKAGWLVRNAITDRLAAIEGAPKRYRLMVQLDDEIEGLGVRANQTVTRERRTLRARYQLFDGQATADAPPVLDQTVSADVGLDVSRSEYATVAAEDSALERMAGLIADRILARLAVSASRRTNSVVPAGE